MESNNSDFADTVRRKITDALGGDPSAMEMTSEFLTINAGLTEDELREAKIEGILVKGDQHWVLAES